jgi:hypothetical protein
MAREPDSQLRRIERIALGTFAAAAVLAVLSGGSWRALLGVVGGGLLVAMSWFAVRDAVDAALRMAARGDGPSRRKAMTWRFVKFVTRFAFMTLLAYVMMVRLRAQPGWMLLGATSLVAAPAIEVLRQLRARS